ncbi:MAG: hypothetical protein V7L22_08495 [Nostoc sp.]|uniref:hypothetical protein n=1 Tax=Nostoc sp. TaxID=1180 RepID=UPI002FF85314
MSTSILAGSQKSLEEVGTIGIKGLTNKKHPTVHSQQSATSSRIIYFLELPKKMYNNLEIPLRNIKAMRCIQ